jgi:hypothetical protein
MVLKPINEELQQRHQASNNPPPVTLLYHDDTSTVLPYEDIPWFLNRFQQLGNPVGINLNLQKTQLLTTLTDQSPLPHLTRIQQQCLTETLQLLGPHAEQRNGIRLLGQPIGSPSYVSNFIDQKIHHLETFTTNKLFFRLQDHQTQLALLKHCIVPSIQHLLATHVYHTYNVHTSNELHQWHTETTIRIQGIIHNVFAQITQQQSLPSHALPIIHLPATLGGIGIRDPIATAVPSAITTFTRSLRYAQFGISQGNTSLPIAPIHQFSFHSSKHRQIIEHFGETLLANLPTTNNKPPDIQTFIQHTQLTGIQKHLYQLHQQQTKQALYDSAPLDLVTILPSLLSPLTSIPLLSLSRRIPTN